MQDHKRVFIVSAPRSGSTWLQLLLSQNEDVVSCQETHLFNGYLKSIFQAESRFARNQRGVGLCNVLSAQDVQTLTRAFAANALTRVADRKPGARILVEKTPGHIYVWQNILHVFPDAYFVEIVRDPRAMVASMRAVDFGNWTVPGVLSNLHRWTQAITSGQALALASDRHIRVRYEDLLTNGVTTCQAIWQSLGEDCSTQQLSAWLAATDISKLRQRDPNVVAPWDMDKEPSNFYRQGEADSWQTELTPRQIALIETVAAAHMERLGYRRTKKNLSFNWEDWLYTRLCRMDNYLAWYRAKL